MATLTIRGLDPVTHARLRVEAARHGRSMEAEVRAILHERLTLSPGRAWPRKPHPGPLPGA